MILGTAQFGNKYGVTNKKQISSTDLDKIFNYLFKNNLKKIDTAIGYGNAEKIIGKYNLNNYFNISTKIFIPKNVNFSLWIEEEINKSLKRTKSKQYENLFIHNPNIFFQKIQNLDKILNSLEILKKRKIIKNIGFSVYSPREIKKLIKIYKPDLIQAPLNIFDQRFIENNFIKLLNKKNIKIQYRSIFLQGVIFMQKKEFKKKFPKFISLFDQYLDYIDTNKISPLENSINFIKSKNLKSFIIGVNSYNHFHEVHNQIKKKSNKVFFEKSVSYKKLINPNLW